jgi:hypothetical protein
MNNTMEVAIIGAGPYGLSIAAHLAKAGVEHRVFGRPMETWATSMPKGMVLKSEGFASSLYDPEELFPLSVFCSENQLPYADVGYPVPLDDFIAYGIEFQRRFVPALDRRYVVSIEPSAEAFLIRLDDEETVLARRVVVATGIRSFDYIPDTLARLPRPYVTHAAEHRDLQGFAGQQVAVVGAGASAGNLMALLYEVGACPILVARRPRIAYCGPPQERRLRDRIVAPLSGLGTGWRSLMCTTAPMLFYTMPQRFRVMVVRRHLGPSPGWTVREQLELLPQFLAATILRARVEGERARLDLRLPDGESKALLVDRVIAATGYRVDMRRLRFLGERTRANVRQIEHTPILSPYFESSLRGLFFAGTTAANSFGPMLRFAFGARFAARRLTRKLCGPTR